MTRQGSRKSVTGDYWQGRLAAARDYHRTAQDALDLASEGRNCAPAGSLAILAAIAYADAITAKKGLVVNQQDHALAPKLLRAVLGNTLPDEQESRFKRFLGKKDEVQYGVRRFAYEDTMRFLADLDQFAQWAEDTLR